MGCRSGLTKNPTRSYFLASEGRYVVMISGHCNLHKRYFGQAVNGMGRNFWKKIMRSIWLISVCVIVYSSLIPRLELPIGFWNEDKLYHFVAYGWLGILPMIGFASRKVRATASLSMVIVGLLLEIGQLHVPGRMFSFADVCANSLGVIAGMVSGKFLRSQLGLDAKLLARKFHESPRSDAKRLN
jgi:VanZ family protein